MERKKDEINKLTDLQYEILDALYFVEPFEKILEEVNASESVIADELKNMIDKKWVQAMEFVPGRNEYTRTMYYDADNMRAYRYLATKEGLLLHNSR